MSFKLLLACRKGAAAAEMALVTPFLVLLLAAAAEVGFYFYEEHRLVESVRDAARYAGRQNFANYATCSGSPPAAVVTNTRLMAAKGSLDSTDPDLLWGWGEAGASFTVTMSCATTVSVSGTATDVGGIYVSNPVGAPSVVVDASIPHQTVFGFLGIPLSLTLNAQQHASVMGL